MFHRSALHARTKIGQTMSAPILPAGYFYQPIVRPTNTLSNREFVRNFFFYDITNPGRWTHGDALVLNSISSCILLIFNVLRKKPNQIDQ
jgi:hypothetical protein